MQKAYILIFAFTLTISVLAPSICELLHIEMETISIIDFTEEEQKKDKTERFEIEDVVFKKSKYNIYYRESNIKLSAFNLLCSSSHISEIIPPPPENVSVF